MVPEENNGLLPLQIKDTASSLLHDPVEIKQSGSLLVHTTKYHNDGEGFKIK